MYRPWLVFFLLTDCGDAVIPRNQTIVDVCICTSHHTTYLLICVFLNFILYTKNECDKCNMGYKLKLKRKKYSCLLERISTLPFPLVEDGKKIACIFNGFSVEVTDSLQFSHIYDNGCYGKGSLSRSFPNFLKRNTIETFDTKTNVNAFETLVLDLEEAFLLTHFVKALEIRDIKGQTVDDCELFIKFCHIKSNFIDSLVAYLYLKSNQWIIKSGIKFGANFLLYKENVRLYHASFAVILVDDLALVTRNIQVIQRVAESADKDVMILQIYKPEGLDITNLNVVFSKLTEFKVHEIILKRFDLAKND